MTRVLVRVPASTANLGPGLDVLAAALALHLEVEVAPAQEFAVHSNLPLPLDRENLVVRAFERICPADGFEFTISSKIPLSGGFGSSAAAVVGGLLAAERVLGQAADAMSLAVGLEGHPDNVAAALRGGFVICDQLGVHRLEPPPGLDAVLVVPGEGVHTERARAELPASVPLTDASFNVAAAVKLVLGISRGDMGLISDGLHDRLHQPYRAHLYPRSAGLLAQATALGALGATISGAGPTVLFWSESDRAEALAADLTALTNGWASVLRVPFESAGAEVREL
jgi:homoserine kinase